MSKTIQDLMDAFAGESQANRKYLAFAEAAEKEGYPQVAKLFRAVAHAETIHAFLHLRAMDAIKSTEENLKAAIEGENYESVTMYPDFLKDAEAEENKRARRAFNYAMEVEKVHEALYREALKDLEAEEDEFDYFVCPTCGYTHARNAPEKCPVCGASGSRFLRFS
jgi:rubrerythrin